LGQVLGNQTVAEVQAALDEVQMPGVKFRVGILAHHHTLAHTLPQFGDPVCMSVWFCLLVSGTQQPKNWGKKNSVVQEKLKSNPRKMEINSLILFYNFIVQNV